MHKINLSQLVATMVKRLILTCIISIAYSKELGYNMHNFKKVNIFHIEIHEDKSLKENKWKHLC